MHIKAVMLMMRLVDVVSCERLGRGLQEIVVSSKAVPEVSDMKLQNLNMALLIVAICTVLF